MKTRKKSMSNEMMAAEDDFCGLGYGRVEYREDHGDSSSLMLYVDDSCNTGEPAKTMVIRGSIEIAGFFEMIDRVRALVEREETT
jgi:hypothetical protein